MRIFLWFSILFFIVSSCQTYSDSDLTTFDEKIQKFIKKSKIKYQKSESGLYYFIEEEGEGDFIKLTDEVSFKYEGKLLNGTIFDGENKRNPVIFPVSKLIQAWQETMLYLKKGGKAKIISPPQLGYGDYDLEAIPKNSILIFELEVLDVK
jgi:FKBP-type peptidyl-prolyl cis-trans isomerase FkpA